MKISKNFASLLLCAFALNLLCSCASTEVPPLTEPRAASYSGNVRNSGVLGVLRAADGELLGFEVDANWLEKHDALTAKYGALLMPPLTDTRRGITPLPNGSHLVTAQTFSAHTLMSVWRASGRQP